MKPTETQVVVMTYRCNNAFQLINIFLCLLPVLFNYVKNCLICIITWLLEKPQKVASLSASSFPLTPTWLRTKVKFTLLSLLNIFKVSAPTFTVLNSQVKEPRILELLGYQTCLWLHPLNLSRGLSKHTLVRRGLHSELSLARVCSLLTANPDLICPSVMLSTTSRFFSYFY